MVFGKIFYCKDAHLKFLLLKIIALSSMCLCPLFSKSVCHVKALTPRKVQSVKYVILRPKSACREERSTNNMSGQSLF